MRRIAIVTGAVTAIAFANLAWVWLARHDSNLRLERRLDARRHTALLNSSSASRVKITQFYATSAEITDNDHATICYGVEDARSVRLEPAVATLSPALTRCFWVEPRQDTTYRLTAEGDAGDADQSSFRLRVKPAPPSILFLALSHGDIVKGDAVTMCYGVDHASTVRLEPIGWPLFATRKNCVRFYPPGTMRYTLVAAGASGSADRESFRVRVR
jgi:hypothetical protein